MQRDPFLNGFVQQCAALLRNSPVSDIEKNLKALLLGSLSELGVVTREEFDIQSRVLGELRQQLQALEQRLVQLEARAPRPRILTENGTNPL